MANPSPSMTLLIEQAAADDAEAIHNFLQYLKIIFSLFLKIFIAKYLEFIQNLYICNPIFLNRIIF